MSDGQWARRMTRRWPRAAWPWAGLAAAVLVVGACDWGRGGFTVANETDVILDVYVTGAGEVPLALDVPPGKASPINQAGCSGRPIVARDPEGREVARRDAPLCDGETWTIHAAGPSS